MGHDIGACIGDADPVDPLEQLRNWSDYPEIAYLQRGSSNPLRHTLYEVLDAREFDGNASGVWAARWFDRNHLKVALNRLRERLAEGQEVQPEIDFVESCLTALPPNRTSVFITFG